MKKLFFAVTLALLALAATAQQPLREHRAIWMSPMLTATWPSGVVNEASKESLDIKMQTLKDQGINVIYYHVRANCDATYASSYEPWSSALTGTRGKAPAFDPFAYLVESAHRYGIEVYAWVNPYRYSSGKTYGAGELNYENSHPEWLIKQSKQIILNPGIPEVQDRIEAIISEIATNYDIDGMLFDDYFYTSDTPESLDAEQYAAYKAAGGTLDQAPWRRSNVNETVRRARDAVKAARPHAVFAMGPAGKISPPDIADYGLEAAPYGDMNYKTMHADPIYWLSRGWLDFLSPQLYWVDQYEGLCRWYAKALPHLGRHLYPSVDVSRMTTYKSATYLAQIDLTRSLQRPNQSGMVFFDYGAYVNYEEKIDGVRTSWGDILAANHFRYITPVPIRYWAATPETNVEVCPRRNGNVLSWEPDANHPGDRFRRYIIYRGHHFDFEDFQPCENIVAVRYTENYTIPQGEEDYNYGVAVYDRYGYIYRPTFERNAYLDCVREPIDATLSGDDQENPADLFDFQWKTTKALNMRCLIEVAECEDFSTLAGVNESYDGRIASANVANLEDGKKYYWRVMPYDLTDVQHQSETKSFVAHRIALTGETSGLSLQPTFTWTAAADGAEYTFELCRTKDFNEVNTVAAYTGSECAFTVPARTIVSGRTYYARVTARRGGASSTSETVAVTTADRTDYAAPEIVNPAADGATVHANQGIEIAPWEGMENVTVEISNTTTFSSRTSYVAKLSDFATATGALENAKVSSKPLEDGATYYVRARGAYSVAGAAALQYTDYSPVRSFVYSAEASIVAVDGAHRQPYVDAAGILHAGAPISTLRVYALDGTQVISAADSGSTTADLSSLAPAAYIIYVNNSTVKWVK